jgi:hypothetical protein
MQIRFCPLAGVPPPENPAAHDAARFQFRTEELPGAQPAEPLILLVSHACYVS